ncbi:MAG: histidine kinase [Hyphomicrobiales bacterium]|nr:histidine kinase [Hyphomicrobiales bacterium]
MADLSRDDAKRPDPEALLALSNPQRRGKLTVFLGAAPGVGKTYAMLSRAKRLKDQGVDIVIGLVETHGRSETAALLDGQEMLPRRKLTYRDREIEEFDIDAALARHPAIIVVDELAHTNAPESRHPKRYQDIEELITAGIDVWTALNIQHLESLSDVVTRIIGTPVREIVPDVVLKNADEVLLVDLAPAELITRLQEGKVYLPDNALRAAEGFFKPGNLTALRELALRRTADRVDDQMVDYLRQNAIEGPWATAERLLVCVGPDELSVKVVRTASRLASGLNAPWLVISIERADSDLKDPAAVRRLDETFRLAERLGAETRRVSGQDFVTEILRVARRENATQIVVGRSTATQWRRLFKVSLPDAIMRRAGDLGVHVVTGSAAPIARARAKPKPVVWQNVARQAAVSAGTVAVATVIGLGLNAVIALPNLSMLFLMAVLVCAIAVGRLAALSAALLSVIAYNFFFIRPVYTLGIAEPHEIFALLIFMIVAVLAGDLAARLQAETENARGRAASTQALFEFSRKLSGTAKLDDVLWAAVTYLQTNVKGPVVLAIPEKGVLQVKAIWPPDRELSVTETTAMHWAFEKREPAGFDTGTLPNIAFQFRPMITVQGVVGVCGFEAPGGTLAAGEERTLSAILDQTAVAIDRARLARENVEQAALKEGEKLQTALLSSISHDLRTPLSTITGAVTSLRQLGTRMSESSRDDLLKSIEEEAARLSRFVSNLLDMTRIEAGKLHARRDWMDVADVVRSSVERAQQYFPNRPVEVSIAPDLPLLRGDSVLLGQVLFNLLDNANKYGGDGTSTSVFARRDGSEVAIAVTDQGKGIPEADLERIFDKFYRRGKPDGRSPGTGLGLSISRGFVEAMGGRIKAESPAVRKRGTRLVMRFPIPDPASVERQK